MHELSSPYSSISCPLTLQTSFPVSSKKINLSYINTVILDEADTMLSDFVEDHVHPDPQDASITESLKRCLCRVMSSLTPREEKVLRMRYGIEVSCDHTLEEVGKCFAVTRERIRQIEAKALRKLRHPSRSEHLRSFLDEWLDGGRS